MLVGLKIRLKKVLALLSNKNHNYFFLFVAVCQINFKDYFVRRV